jgi:hypothetical protein
MRGRWHSEEKTAEIIPRPSRDQRRRPDEPVDLAVLLISINTMESDMTADTGPTAGDTAAALRDVLGARLADVDLGRAMTRYRTPEALATRMLDTLPDVAVTDPPIGACYSAPALARWKQLSRQAIDQQRRSGRLFGVMVGGRMLHPSAQFDNHGRQSRAFVDLYAHAGGSDPVEFAVWMETPDPVTGVRPSDTLRRAPDTRTSHERLLDGFVPTIVEPPYGAAATQPGTKR